jgi:hypothetical protein
MLFESAVADDSFLQFPLLYQRWWKRLRELLIAPLHFSIALVVAVSRFTVLCCWVFASPHVFVLRHGKRARKWKVAQHQQKSPI